jgi:hypothetical protein
VSAGRHYALARRAYAFLLRPEASVITFESTTAATSGAELLDIVRREYRAVRAS